MRLGLFYKVSVLSTSLIFTGRLFHRVGAAATNALSPNALYWFSSQVGVVCFKFQVRPRAAFLCIVKLCIAQIPVTECQLLIFVGSYTEPLSQFFNPCLIARMRVGCLPHSPLTAVLLDFLLTPKIDLQNFRSSFSKQIIFVTFNSKCLVFRLNKGSPRLLRNIL